MWGRALGVCIVLVVGSCTGDRGETEKPPLPGPTKPPGSASAPQQPPIVPAPDAAGSQHPHVKQQLLPIEMGWSDAASYARTAGYADVRVGADPNALLAEGEKCTTPADCRTKRPRLIFEYARANDDKPPACISVMQGGPLDWKGVIARYTGADVAGLREPKPKANGMIDDAMTIKSNVGTLKILVDGDKAVFNVSFGPGCEK